jgi:hypothetical protein
MLDDFAQDPNEKAVAEFYRTPKQDKAKTAEEGRPVFKMVEYVRISVPGDKNNLVDCPVKDEHRARFRAQYAAFVADKPQDEAVGTPLSAWAGLSPERVAEYQYMKVATVEQLAGVSDLNIQRMGAGTLAERQRARDYIEAAKSRAPMLRAQAENAALRSEMEALRNALKEQGDRLESVAAGRGLPVATVKALAPHKPAEVVLVDEAPKPPPRKRGRPAKAAHAT